MTSLRNPPPGVAPVAPEPAARPATPCTKPARPHRTTRPSEQDQIRALRGWGWRPERRDFALRMTRHEARDLRKELFGPKGVRDVPPGRGERWFELPCSKCGYYVNSAGHQVPRPCGNWRGDPTPPRGATALCRDGTWSWSEHPHAPGTCSHHGGVARRL